VLLAKLRAERIREWRDDLGLSPGATNRTLTALKAALNLAVHDRHASAELTMELRRVKPLPGGKKPRDLYLDLRVHHRCGNLARRKRKKVHASSFSIQS
jgi:hypothetical protein